MTVTLNTMQHTVGVGLCIHLERALLVQTTLRLPQDSGSWKPSFGFKKKKDRSESPCRTWCCSSEITNGFSRMFRSIFKHFLIRY